MVSGQKGRSDVCHPRWTKDLGMNYPYNCLGIEHSCGSKLMGGTESVCVCVPLLVSYPQKTVTDLQITS